MVSIVIPVVRPDRAKECISAIERNVSGIPYEIVTREDTDRIGAPKMVKALVEESKHDRVMFLGDDTIPQPNFMTKTLQAMSLFPDGWGLVGLNDGIHDGSQPNVPATHWMAHKRLLPFLDGEFFHTGYWHCFCDNELTDRCREMKRYLWCEAAKIEHKHPIRNAAPWDEDYQRVYSRKYHTHDYMLFIRRRANQWKIAA